ncbi:MurR/RpiR family transcriptional regulator [Edaphobacillus lindanitolerans]|uniref:Transcriptional regulator, RpiR family n=1 Tax=Edaphobacillus lindanitolerans TaxID=550447 RepID=A0A1U7PRF7_9BACI|nr:MurR/RpiR family transcriptional regulator [Edaphobacillus lindanitolerans]SIT92689.1 transcriptional regulator, RpiR family [Edaphobacillus lindanitolerans]
MTSLLIRIEQNLNQLSDAERKIAEYVLGHPEMIPNMTTRDLSKNSGVSESSIVRFCKSIGIGSYKSFKMELVKDLTLSGMNLTDFNILQKKDEPYDLFQKVTHVNKSAIEAIPSVLDRKEFERAIGALLQAGRIFFFGVGGSATAAIDAHYKFTKLGYHSLANQDFHFMLSAISHLDAKDVFFAVSISGKTKDVLELARFAKAKGATVIAITNLDKSPLYREADIRLCTPIVEHDHRIGSIPSRMTQLTIIDALYLSLFHQKGVQVIGRYQDARDEAIRLRR